MSDVFTTKVNVGLIFQPTEMMKVGNLSKFVWNQSLSVFYDQFWNLNLCKVWLGQQHKTSKYWIVAETLFLLSKDSNAPFENLLHLLKVLNPTVLLIRCRRRKLSLLKRLFCWTIFIYLKFLISFQVTIQISQWRDNHDNIYLSISLYIILHV